MDIVRKLAIGVIDIFEELLDKKGIKIPSEDRDGNEEEACIYGEEYCNLEDTIVEFLNKEYAIKRKNI